jgi:glycosyltransferase involved in cell wall biosynthesis
MACHLGIDGLVDMRSNVPQEDLPRYFSAADICVVPSAYESFGMVAIESLACETPVVAFGVGGLATTIEHERTGYLARPGDFEDFSHQVNRALANPELRTMGRRGRLSVQRYDWATVADRTRRLYDEVAAEYGSACTSLASVS